ncbi:hypothetical protein ACFL25_00030 [Patescibacteria group bacterium]
MLVGLVGRFLIGVVVGFTYVYFFTHILAPVKLQIKGRHLHHNLKGSIYGIFIILPLVFFFYVLNFDLLNYETALKLGASLLGLTVGTIIEHKSVHGKDK